MKNIIKKGIGIALLLALVITMLPAAEVKAATYIPSQVVVYNTDNNNLWADGSIYLENIKKLSNVKSSTSKIVVDEYSVSKSASYSYKNKTVKKTGGGILGTIRFHSDKICKGNITYKVNGKKHTTKVVVKKYTNPIDTLKVSNIGSGKNLASYFKSSAYYSDDDHKLKWKNSDRPKITVKAKKGWKIVSISAEHGLDDGENSVSYEYWDKNKTSATVTAFESTKDGYKIYRIIFVNIKDGGMITVTLDIPDNTYLDPNY